VHTYRHEDILSVDKVQRRKDGARPGILVALDPALGEQIPLGVEFPAELTTEPSIQGCQKNGDAIIARGGREFSVGGVDELDGGRRDGFGVVLLESLFRRLLCGQRPDRKEDGDESRQPAHLDFHIEAEQREKEGLSRQQKANCYSGLLVVVAGGISLATN